jgi:hypothetical protein
MLEMAAVLRPPVLKYLVALEHWFGVMNGKLIHIGGCHAAAFGNGWRCIAGVDSARSGAGVSSDN